MPMPQGAQDPMSLQFEKKEKTRPAPVTKFALHRKQEGETRFSTNSSSHTPLFTGNEREGRRIKQTNK